MLQKYSRKATYAGLVVYTNQ